MADETLRDFLIQIGIEQEQVELLPPDDKELTKSLEAIKSKVHSSAEGMTGDLSGIKEEVQGIIKTHKDLEQELADSAGKIQMSQLQAAEGFKMAGEGAFKFARGIAFLSASSDEDLAKMMKKVAAVQGGFELFKGSIETIKGLRMGLQALNTVMATTTTVTKAQTAANVGLTASMGPVGIALAAVAAAISIGVALWAAFGDEAEENTEKAEKGTKEATDALEEYKHELADIRVDLEQFGSASLKSMQEVRKEFDLITKGSVDYAARLNEIKGVEDELVAARAVAIPFVEDTKATDKERLALSTALLDLQKDIVSTQQLQLQTQKEAIDAANKQIDQSKEKVRLAEEELKKQKEIARQAQIQAGRLTTEDRQRVEQLITKKEGGKELTPEELKELESLAGSVPALKEFADKFFAQLGQALADRIQKAFGGEALTEALKKQEQIFATVREQEQRVQEKLRVDLEARKQAQAAVLKVLEDSITFQQEVQRKVTELERKLRDFTQRNGA